MSKITLNSRTPSLAKQEDGEDRKSTLTAVEPEPVDDREDGEVEVQDPCVERARMERIRKGCSRHNCGTDTRKRELRIGFFSH